MPRSSDTYRKPGILDRAVQRMGFRAYRNVYWSWYQPRNFGDWITPFLFEAITGEQPIFCSPRAQKNLHCVYGAGSILRKIRFPDRVTVWGSGVISGNDEFARPAKVLAVRGPYSAERLLKLGYTSTETFGDPAILLPRYYHPVARMVPGRIGVIPHFRDVAAWDTELPEGMILIDVCQPVDMVVEAIASCEMTIASSLHGMIVSQAYGRQSLWIAARIPLEGDDIKFRDYLEAGGVLGAAPATIEVCCGLSEIESAVRAATQPDIASLIPALEQTCPFSTIGG